MIIWGFIKQTRCCIFHILPSLFGLISFPSLQLELPQLFYFWFYITLFLLFPSHAPPPLVMHLYFPGFYFNSHCTLTSEDLELGNANKRKYAAFVFLLLLLFWTLFIYHPLPTNFIFLFSWVEFHSVYVPYFHYSFTGWRTFRFLFPLYCE